MRDEHLTSGLAICSNGALIYDFSTDAVSIHQCLDVATARNVVHAMQTALPGCTFAMEFPDWVGREADSLLMDPPSPERERIGDPHDCSLSRLRS